MDDLGFTDTGHYSNYLAYNDYSFSMPNIEMMAENGIRLNYHYAEAVYVHAPYFMLSVSVILYVDIR